jgi:hypothetical protein
MQTKVTVASCDRCGFKQQFDNLEDQWRWGFIHAEQHNGPIKIGKIELRNNGLCRDVRHKDLCPACISELDDWYYQTGKFTPPKENEDEAAGT